MTASLIALDKWSGSMGEIALEMSLLKRLRSAKSGIIPAISILGLYQPIEDITGSIAKVAVRSLDYTTVILPIVLIFVATVTWMVFKSSD